NSYIYSGASIGIPEDNNYDTLARWVDGYLKEGYRRIKIKIKPGWDIKALETTRKVIGDDFILWPDANASYSLKEHKHILEAMDRFDCSFIEQPLHQDDILEHNKLSNIIKTPICLDESLKSKRVAERLIEIDGPKIWNIKIQR